MPPREGRRHVAAVRTAHDTCPRHVEEIVLRQDIGHGVRVIKPVQESQSLSTRFV